MARRIQIALVAFAAACVSLATPLRADVIPSHTKFVKGHALFLADRFDDYCEHRRTIREGDTLAKIAQEAYGDAARSAEIQKANDGLVPEKLKIGAAIVLPPKLAPPADARDTLAWRFYSYSKFSPVRYFERVYPGERFDSPGKACALVAVPTAKAAEFESLLATHREHNGVAAVMAAAPWAIASTGFRLNVAVSDRSDATESTTTFKIAELGANDQKVAVFRLAEEDTEYVDGSGHAVKAGFGLPLNVWTLLAIAAIGALGFARMRRKGLLARGR